MRVETVPPFVPAAPPRPAHAPPLWKMFVGELARNPVAACCQEDFRELYATRPILNLTYHAVSDPEGVRRVLLDNHANYVKPGLLGRVLPGLQDGLFGADGEAWRSQRKLMAPVFTPAAVADFMPVFSDVARRSAQAWTPGVVDVARTATRATFEIIGEALFSSEHGLSSDEAARHVAAALAGATRPKPSMFVPGAGWMDGLTAGGRGQAFLRERIAAFIAARQSDPRAPGDFMTRLIAAFAVEHAPREAAHLALSNAFTFLVAGHETTANALAWTLYLLSEQPEAQAWAAEEARAALTAGARGPETLERLVYLRWVLEEALRLYPPAYRIEREAAGDDEVGPLRIRKGDLVGIWPWLVHRHETLWENPDAFDPERFAPEARARYHRFQYIPFGAGPRICIGAQFATAEALLILAHWLAGWRFEPTPGRQMQVASDMTLRPKGGLPLIVSRR
jgi:cytochrome P450